MRVVDKAKKESAITLAAIKEFAKSGYEKSAISDIAAQAGVATGGIYNYFKNKEALFCACCKYVHTLFMDGLRDQIKKSDPIYETIKYALSFFKENIDYARLTFMEARNFSIRFPDSEVAHIWYKRINEFLFDNLHSFLPKSPSVDPQLYLSIILGGVEHIVMLSIFTPHFIEMNTEDIARKIQAIIERDSGGV